LSRARTGPWHLDFDKSNCIANETEKTTRVLASQEGAKKMAFWRKNKGGRRKKGFFSDLPHRPFIGYSSKKKARRHTRNPKKGK
jgi:hypothetical protein